MKPRPSSSNVSAKWEADPLDWTRVAGHAEQLLAAVEARKKRQKRRRIAAGAAAALVVGFLAIFSTQRMNLGPVPMPTGKAIVTAPVKQVLPDGTVVELKPGARIEVNFTATSANHREVTLALGEALFQVAKNPARPFVVTAGGVRFRAVGTAFSVDLKSASVEMLVTEGKVAVEPTVMAGAPVAEAIATVEAGHRVEVQLAQAPAPEVMATTAAEAKEKLAWRVPRLEFNETPLWEVVSLLNQHSGSHISLANADLGRVEISGALKADNIDPLLETLQANYRIQVVRRADGAIELKQDR